MKPMRAVLWDMDGTLIDSEHIAVEALRRAMLENGLPDLPDLYDRVVGKAADVVYRSLVDEFSLNRLLERHAALMDSIDSAVQRAPDTVRPHLLSAQEKILQNIPPALVPYHTAVEAYNLALSQAPARWLANGLRLRPALALTWPVRMPRTNT